MSKKESLTFYCTASMGTFTARSAGYKASSTNSLLIAAERLIEKIYGYEPLDLEIKCVEGPIVKNPSEWVATWAEASKEKEAA